MIATHLLYTAAGSPRVPGAEPAQGACWWCCAVLAQGAPVATMPDTFLDACGRDAGSPASRHLCPACAWTLSDAIRLPVHVGTPLLHRALHGDQEHPGRVSVAVGEEAPARRLVTWVGPDERIGVWERPGRAPDETRWVAARSDLRTDPRDVGPARYLGTYSAHDLARSIGGKFRNFIPFATATRWEMWTKADKVRIRAVLLNPPRERWTLAIGDGQKHAAIYARVSDGSQRAQVVYFDGGLVFYAPDVLSGLLDAVERLLTLGARREAIESGRYPVAVAARPTAQTSERTVRRHRGGPLLGLALWLAARDTTPEETT